MGPSNFDENDVCLRTAVSVERDGWADFGCVKMPDYRWGIFLKPNERDRVVGFGDHLGAVRTRRSSTPTTGRSKARTT